VIEAAGDLGEEAVAGLVAHAVGDDADAIDVDGEDRALTAGVAGLDRTQDAVEAREEGVAQHQAGDGVGGFVAVALRLLGFAAGDVADDADAADGFAVGVGDAAGAQLDPALTTFGVAHAHLKREGRVTLAAMGVERVRVS
jgi:hypothetical protein